MPIPDYQTVMQPVLAALADGNERNFNQLLPILTGQFHLTEEERAQRLPNGRQETFRNRVHWAWFYLRKAGLLERPRRGHLKITARGLEALQRGSPINNAFLRQFPEFREFASAGAGEGGEPQPAGDDEAPPHRPEEQVEAGCRNVRENRTGTIQR